MKPFLFILVTLLTINFAHAEELASKTWTYETGVRLKKIEQCTNGSGKPSVSVRGTPKEYEIKILAFFNCDRKIKKPWLNLPQEGKATLVLDAEQQGVFSSSCECLKSLSVGISDRLSKGDVLYIVNGQEVVGHVVMP